MSGETVSVALEDSDVRKRGMGYRRADKAFFYAPRDAMEGNGDLELVGENAFQPEIARPVVDDLMDEKTVPDILRRTGRSGYA